VPGNSDAPAQRLLRELCADPRWSGWVGGFAHPHLTACRAEEYVAHLARPGRHLDAWETTYVHLLQGEDPVLRWTSGTGLRPVLAALDAVPAERAAFLATYAAALREAYPAGEAGTVFPFRRVFVVAGSGTGRRQSAAAGGAEART
jgi:trans-aconitate 2-methyltransferase